ncbi:hypothetical protein G6F57_018117 [Rhizopus arrhizus]|nr:hypothetical protein G6F57_018117 [Rhizopus arrhizus]
MVHAAVQAQALQQVDHVFAGDIAAGALGIRATTGAGPGAVDHARAVFQAGGDVGDGLAVGVVEVHGQRRHRNLGGDRLQHRPRLARGTDADGVAQRDFVAAHLVQGTGHAHHVGQRYFALVGAAEHGGHIAAHTHAIGGGPAQDRLETGQRLVDAGIGVGAVERFGGGGEHRHFLHADRAGTVVTLFVRHQHRIADAGPALDAGIDLGGIGQLRDPLRADEAGRLDAAQAGGRQAVDQPSRGPTSTMRT